VLIPAFVGLLWQLDGVRHRRGAFLLGWAFGVGQFAAGLYWVGIAFFVDAPAYAWMVPFAVAGLAAGLAIFTGLVTLAVWLVPWYGVARVLTFAVAWSAAEWLRGHVLTGFPWNLQATVWSFSDIAVQPVALFGAYGLTLVTVFAALAPATLVAAGGPWRRWGASAVAAVVIAAMFGGGALRLDAAPTLGSDTVADVRLRLVQANIPQQLKWDPELRRDHLERHIEMSAGGPDSEAVTHVIWPETAVSYFLENTEGLRGALARAVPDGGRLLTGLPRFEGGGDDTVLYNSLVALDQEGATRARYDKFHLVPFGEYVPFSRWLPLERLTPGRLDFSAGPGPRTLRSDGLPPFSPLICYEAIFPGNVLNAEDRPEWLLNITNDAWFGVSSGPYQHLASARLRAVEEGLPLVRAANTGISIVVDAHGRELHRLGLNRRGTIDADLPRALETMTVYARLGDLPFAGILAIVLILAGYLRKA
jgi:apolipoprotein N-acyltransferase